MTGALKYCPELKQDSRSRRKKHPEFSLSSCMILYVSVLSSCKTVGGICDVVSPHMWMLCCKFSSRNHYSFRCFSGGQVCISSFGDELSLRIFLWLPYKFKVLVIAKAITCHAVGAFRGQTNYQFIHRKKKSHISSMDVGMLSITEEVQPGCLPSPIALFCSCFPKAVIQMPSALAQLPPFSSD